MLQKSTYETAERWPEKSAGVLVPCRWIALIFLDFFVLLYQDKRTYKSDCINRTENKSAFTDSSFEEDSDSPLLIDASPNPANSLITFELSLINKRRSLHIQDIFGKSTAELPLYKDQNQHIWDCSGVSRGIYFYQSEMNRKVYKGKIIIYW